MVQLTQAETVHTRLERERKAANPKPGLLRTFRKYARGDQKGTLTTKQQDILRGLTGNRFCDNVCKMVLLAATGRLQLARFEVADESVEKWLKAVWTLASMPLFSNQVHWAALRDGDHAVSLSWDNEKGQVRFSREKWWDGKSGIFIAYDAQDQPAYAVKEWTNAQGKLRRVIWWPDRIERYIADGEGWRPYALNAETPWQEKWVDADEQPLGLPVVHFRNIYMPNDSSDDDADSSYGVSELDGGVLGLQDEINDVQRDLTSGGRYTGYQMLWGTGVTLDENPDGTKKALKVEPGAFFTSQNAQASYGTLPAGDLSQLERLLNVKLRAVSRMTSTPLHEITGDDWPSGEALLRADKPLVAKVTAIGGSFGPSWSSLMHKATLLANAFGAEGLNTDVLITAVFQAPDKSDGLTQSKIADGVSKHVSRREVLRVLGKGPEQQDQILKEIKEDKEAAQAMAVANQAAIAAVTPPAPPGQGAPPSGKPGAPE
ncbi:MAG TPA: phage portal protein [Chloroflexia bacterium]|nr:phage portal protein [Chloroflexia bacterium]